jgi:hypothetical protein
LLAFRHWGWEQYLWRVALRGSGENNLPQCLHFLLRVLITIGLKPPRTNGVITIRRKRKRREEKSEKKTGRSVYSDILVGRRLQGRKQHFQTAILTTISDCRWDYPKKKIYSSRKIKKTLRSPDFKKQLLSAFQAVAN